MTDRRFDIVFAGSCRLLRTSAIARHTKLPAVLYLQEPYRRLYEALPQLPWLALSPAPGGRYFSPRFLKRWLSDWIVVTALRAQAREELQHVKAFHSVLVNSLFSRESVLRAYGLDARVCYLGVDTELFVDRREARETLVVGIGAFVREKNIEFVLKALAAVRHPHRRLVWIGNMADARYLEELSMLASRLGVRFEPLHRVSDVEIVHILNRATLMAYAPRLEPFGLAPLEANACGLPVVAVAEGGVRETVVHEVNGLLCEPEPQAMSAAIEQLLDDPAYARRLGTTGRELAVQHWSLEAAVSRLETRLAETLVPPRTAPVPPGPVVPLAPYTTKLVSS